MLPKGYVIVGVEQTSGSVSLLDFKFPSKCVLVVGHENCGTPAEYLRLMDAFVEVLALYLSFVTTSLTIYLECAFVRFLSLVSSGILHPSLLLI